MQTYRELFGVREFGVVFAVRCVTMLSVAASGLALGTTTYAATGSAVLTALSMFGGPLVSLVAAQLLLAGSDRYRPRTGMTWPVVAALAANLVQAVPGLPWPARFVALAVPYAVGAMFGGSAWVVVRAVVPEESFVLARSALNLAVGGMQVVGSGLGGVALLVLTPRDLFLVAAALNAVCLAAVRLGVRDRPAPAPSAHPLVARTRAVNRALLGSRVVRPLYVAMWVPNGLVVGCESLFVPYGARAGHSLAGVLFAAGAAGMMVGDLVVGRYVPARHRDRLIGPLRLLLATPYLTLLLDPPVGVTVAAACVASVGYGASLPLQERLFGLVDAEVQGQTMALYGQGLAVGQAVGALVAGSVAAVVGPAYAIGVVSVLSLGVTVLNTPGLRRSAPGATDRAQVHPAGRVNR